MTNAPDSNAAATAQPQDVLALFVSDFISGANSLIKHQTGGVWAAIILSLILTMYVWWVYGAAAGAPLAASFFICVAMVMPSK